jgi:hypothetical protein
MAPRSRIELDPRIKARADELIRDGKTVNEILEALNAIGANVSHSSVGRYRKKNYSVMERVSEAREVASVWVDKFGSEPDGDIGQLLPMLLHALAFAQINTMSDAPPDLSGKEGPSPRHVALMAGAIKDIASAQKITADRILKVRKETAEKAADEVDKVAKSRGLSPDAVAEIRSKILGVAA